MITVGFVLLILCHFICGLGLLHLFGIRLSMGSMLGLSLILGVALASFIPFALELFHLKISAISVLWGLIILTVFCCIPIVIRFKLPDFKNLSWPLHLYDYPYLFIYGVLLSVSIWHCYYYPVLPRDMLSGPEVMAEYALKEGTMINSIFKIDLQTTNNQLKPPYITSLQIIYKLFVNPFGQLWLSVTVVGFVIWLYSLLRKTLHPLIGGFVLLFFLVIPEMYAYTYMILFDYSNAVFFFAGFYFLARFIRSKNKNEFWFSSFAFGIATYIRTETLILVVMTLPLLLFYLWRDKTSAKQWIIHAVGFSFFTVVFYFLVMNVFIKGYIPSSFDVASQVNKHLTNLSPLFDRLYEMSSKLIFSDWGTGLYGYFIRLFIFVLAVDAIFFRSFSKEAVVAIYGVLIVYIGLGIIGWLLPLADLSNTTKRGLFKIFPLMLFYLANSASLIKLSSLINNWEYSKSSEPQAASEIPATRKVKSNKK
ncbi:MAG: hypothetical protein JSS64_00255 [Bacteroidetes bacterium]|nr:hypothetical protein [Bacteroidota bacterium]